MSKSYVPYIAVKEKTDAPAEYIKLATMEKLEAAVKEFDWSKFDDKLGNFGEELIFLMSTLIQESFEQQRDYIKLKPIDYIPQTPSVFLSKVNIKD